MAPRYLAGAAYVQVLPSLRGFQKSIAGDLKAIDVKATAQIVPQLDKVAATKAEDDVKALSERLEKARVKEADAIGKVRVAETKLQALRASGKATTDQLTAAEERLATATRASDQARKTAAVSAKAVESAQIRHKQAVDDLGKSAIRGASALTKLWRQGEGIDGISKSMRTARQEALGLAAGVYRVASGVTAIGTAAPAVVGLGSALGTAAGAGLILPGTLVAGQVAVNTLKLGVSGLGEAMKAAAEGDAKKLAEAMEKLAPPAQAVVNEYLRMKPALDGVRLAVQARLFAGLAGEVRQLGRDYLPIVKTGLVGMAGELNAVGKETAGFLRQQQTLADVPLIFDRSTVAVGNLTTTVQPLLSILRDIVAVGVTVLADLTAGWTASASGAAAFIAEARASGQITAWIHAGLDTLHQFGNLFANVGGIVNTVLGAAQMSGGGVLATLVMLTGEIKAMLQSAQGTSALATLFGTLQQVVQALLPGVQAVAGALFSGIIALGPQLPALAAAFSLAAVAVAPLLTDLAMLAAVVLPPLVSLLTWLAPALPAIAVGFVAGAIALKGYAIVSSIIRWYQAWAAAQWALNAAMAANPIGIIIVAVAALVAAIVWIATQTTWFQDLWAVVWGAIKTAALWVWENALKPAFNGIVAAFQAVGAAASWLWNTILKPVFDAISFVVRLVAAIIITILLTPLVLAFKALAVVALWLWETVLAPVFAAIGAVARWLWDNVLSPVIDYIVAGVQAWAAVFSWLWTNAISPALSAIGTALSWLWTNVVQPVFALIGVALSALGTAFGWVWDNVIKPVWDALGTAIGWVWENLIKPVFEAIKSAVGTVGEAFGKAVDFIKSVWDTVFDILSTPVKWIIDVVYNNGIRAIWNKVAGLVGLGELPAVNFDGSSGSKGGRQQHMAHGGVLPGYAPGVDSIPVLASPGEGWLVPEAVRGLGAGFVGWANRFFSGGRSQGGVGTGGPAGFSQGGVVQRFADGGIVGNILNWVSGIGDDIVGLWKDPVGYIKSRLSSGGGWADAMAQTPAKLIGDGASWLWGKIKSFFGFASDEAAAAAGGAGGRPAGWQQMWEIIRAQFPSATLNSAFRPGDPGYHGKGRAIDIGGPMDAINQWIARVYPNSTQLIYTPGANILNGAPFTYDAPTQADHFDHVHWAFDQGGYLPPGYSTVYNGTGRPEPVLTDQQWNAMGQQASGGEFTGALYLDSGEFLGRVRGEVSSALDSTGTAIGHRRRS